MPRVRFLDPDTNEVVYPGLSDATDDPITPSLEAPAPPVGFPALNLMLTLVALSWDVRHPFEVHAEGWRQQEVGRLVEPATSPPTARLEIQSPQLPWKIEVRAGTPNLHVTVYDVLATIYETLKTRISRGEWERLHDTQKYVVLMARDRRAQGYDFSRMVDEYYHHPRRVDSLGECTQFVGLVPAPYRGCNSFDLEFVRQG